MGTSIRALAVTVLAVSLGMTIASCRPKLVDSAIYISTNCDLVDANEQTIRFLTLPPGRTVLIANNSDCRVEFNVSSSMVFGKRTFALEPGESEKRDVRRFSGRFSWWVNCSCPRDKGSVSVEGGGSGGGVKDPPPPPPPGGSGD